MTRTAVLICPGRGTYGRGELGTLARHFPDPELLATFDADRETMGRASLTALDAGPWTAAHQAGENAAALIYAASLGDALALSDLEVVAVTGNSMGWYTALAAGGALSPRAGLHLVDTMAGLMQAAMIGGQIVYPFLGPDWSPDPAAKADLLEIVAGIDARPEHDLALSIDLGGMLVLGGNGAGLAAFEAAVPRIDRFPMRLPGHAAFHTWLQAPVAEAAVEQLGIEMFGTPTRPLIDGLGTVWWPGATRREDLRAYTLGTQVTEAYDFTAAIRAAAREFAPDLFIVTGPGTTLGGAVAQALILADWQGLDGKAAFQARQEAAPLLISMGRPEQRILVSG